MNYDKCEVKRCRGFATFVYYKKLVCDKCWEQHCEPNNELNLKEVLEIENN